MKMLKKHLRVPVLLGAGLLMLALVACGLPETPIASLATAGFSSESGDVVQQLTGYQFPVVQVNGHGTAAGTPDTAGLSLAVSVTAETVAEARLTAATTMERVITSLVANGIEEREIGTSFFRVRPEYDYSGERREIAGYTVSNGLEVTVRAIDSVGLVIDDAIAAGGDHIVFNNLRYTIADVSDLQRMAREAAVDDMQDRASQLAEFSGLQLGDLRMVSESPLGDVFQETRAFALSAGAAADAGTPTLPGEAEVSVTVHGLYELLPAE